VGWASGVRYPARTRKEFVFWSPVPNRLCGPSSLLSNVY
jgi:hypothetical protein